MRPLLQYGTVIWSPFLKRDIFMIESVQKRFSKKICYHCNISNTSFSHFLNMLNLKSLEYRRLVFDVMFMYTIILGNTNLMNSALSELSQ